jgi:hypothetical protein
MNFTHTDECLGTLDLAEAESKQLIENVDQAEKAVAKAVEVLDDIEEISDRLKKLDSSSRTIYVVLGSMRLLPVVGSACGNTRTVVKLFRDVIHPASTNLEKLYRSVEPVHRTLRKFDAGLKSTEIKLGQYYNGLDTLEDLLKKAKKCANKKGSDKCCEAIETFTQGAQPPIHASYLAFREANKSLESIADGFKAIVALAPMVNQIDNILDEAWKVLREISKITDGIELALRQKISVPYSFKVKVKVKVTKKKWWKVLTFWEWKWRARSKTFSFRVRDIIKGINTGIDFVNKKLMSLAKKVLGKAGTHFPKLPTPPVDKLVDKIAVLKLPAIGDPWGKIHNLKIPDIEALVKGFDNPCK